METKWIPIAEKMPPEREDVLLWMKKGFCEVGCWHNGTFVVSVICIYVDKGNVLAWMPLPEPYTGKE